MQIYVSGVKEVKKIDDYTVDLILSRAEPGAAEATWSTSAS